MSVQATEVEIQRPCPVDLPDDFRGDAGAARSNHCGHCNKTVHLLSSLTEAEAKTFLEQSAGRDVCVTYLVDGGGNIVFRPEPTIVPITSLKRRPRIAAVAAVGLGLALAACAPHDNPRVESQTIQVADEPCEAKPPVVPVEVQQHVVAGGIGPVEMPPVVEPPVTPPPTKVEPETKRPPMHAGKPTSIRPTMMRGGRG